MPDSWTRAADGSWHTEKSERALEANVRLLDLVRRLGLKTDDEWELLELLRVAILEGSYLLASAIGVDWKPADLETIWRDGYRGLCRVTRTYFGESSSFRWELEQMHADAWTKAARLALHDGADVGERMHVHKLLANLPFEHGCVRDLRELTERMSAGEIKWEEYLPVARDLVDLIELSWPVREKPNG